MNRKEVEVKLSFHEVEHEPIIEIWEQVDEIDSTNVEQLLYNKRDKLIVTFHHGGKHHYSDVSPLEFELVVQADSIGKALREHIINKGKPSYKIQG